MKLTIFSLVLGMFASVRPSFAQAVGGLNAIEDITNNQTVSSLSDHNIKFQSMAGVASGQTIVITFPATFDGSGGDPQGILDVTDVDMTEDTTTDPQCEDAGSEASEGLVASGASASQWNTVFSGQLQRVLTFTSGGASAIIAANSDVCIQIGETANGVSNDFGVVSSNSQYKNPTSLANYEVQITAGTSSTGDFALAITENSNVVVSANIDATISFDIDTGTAQNSNNNGPHTIALGTLSSGTLTTSNQSTINSIFLDLDTNASGGATLTVRGLNGGLRSALANNTLLAPAGGEATIAAGTETFGLCLESVTQGTPSANLVKDPKYDPTDNGAVCTFDNGGGTQRVGDIMLGGGPIISAPAGIQGGRAEILVKAAISVVTKAGNDYSETLTFIATGKF